MTLTRLPRTRRILGGSLFVLVLAALGACLFVALPAEPRWTLADVPRTLFFVKDGVVATCCLGEGTWCGPVELWDVETGQGVQQFFTDGPQFLAYGRSADGRWFVGVATGAQRGLHRICWVDLVERRAWEVEAELGDFESASALFSSRCDVLAVRHRKRGVAAASYVIVDTSTGRVLDRFTIPFAAPMESEMLDYWQPRAGEFTSDGDHFAVGYVEGETHHIRLTNTRLGKTTLLDDADLIVLSPESGALIAARGEAGTWIWDVAADQWRCPIGAELNSEMVFSFSPDRRLIACVPIDANKDVAIRFFELKSGQEHWDFRGSRIQAKEQRVWAQLSARFSPDSRSFLLAAESQPTRRFQCVYCDVQSKERLWDRSCAERFCNLPLITPDSGTVIAALPDLGQVEIIDAKTGQTRHTIALPGSTELNAQLAADGTLLVEQQPSNPAPSRWSQFCKWLLPNSKRELEFDPSIMHVYDLGTGSELCRVPGLAGSDCAIAPDGRSMVLLHHHYNQGGGLPISTTLQCWDLPPRTPLRWVFGVPPAVGVVLLLLFFFARRIRGQWLIASRSTP